MNIRIEFLELFIEYNYVIILLSIDFSGKLCSLCIYTEFSRYLGRIWKRNIRSEWFVITCSYIEQFCRTRCLLPTRFRGNAYTSADEPVTAKSTIRRAGTLYLIVFIFDTDWFLINYVYLQTFEFITNNDGTVVYLYRLTIGHTVCSFAHAAAQSAGLDQRVINRAKEVIEIIYY